MNNPEYGRGKLNALLEVENHLIHSIKRLERKESPTQLHKDHTRTRRSQLKSNLLYVRMKILKQIKLNNL